MATKMRCPHCGADMNHHADKVVAPTERDPGHTAFDAVLGGVVQETHACSACGNVEFRTAPPLRSSPMR